MIGRARIFGNQYKNRARGSTRIFGKRFLASNVSAAYISFNSCFPKIIADTLAVFLFFLVGALAGFSGFLVGVPAGTFPGKSFP